MANFFKKKQTTAPANNNKPDTVNPYLDARRTWNDENSAILAQNRLLQVITLMSLLIGLAVFGAYVYERSQSKFVPYIVEVDKLGKTAAVAQAERMAPADPNVIRSYVAAFIENARMVTPDASLQRKAIFDVYAMLQNGTAATNRMNQYLNGSPDKTPFARAETETASIQIESVLAQTESTWQVIWLEQITDREGIPIGEPTRWRALITIDVIPPDSDTKEEQIQRNPSGVYVRDFSWSKQI